MERDKRPADRMLGNIALSDLKAISPEDIEQLLLLTDQVDRFQELMMKYECAMYEVKTKLDVLNKELSLRNNRNPFESIKTRIKTPISLFEKMQRKGLAFSVENIEENINDVAGIRVICSFLDDIYMLADCLKQQDDIKLIEVKDYIEDPKASGYRSLHLILEVPIFLTHEKQYMKVEVQFRTIAMDFWASLEHKMKYKKNIQDAEMITEDLCFSADLINQLDRRMQQIRERIDSGKVSDDSNLILDEKDPQKKQEKIDVVLDEAKRQIEMDGAKRLKEQDASEKANKSDAEDSSKNDSKTKTEKKQVKTKANVSKAKTKAEVAKELEQLTRKTELINEKKEKHDTEPSFVVASSAKKSSAKVVQAN